MKRILIFGLPGSGKSTLAKRLVEILGNADWHNADDVRKTFDDWDFSDEGRKRQSLRMRDYVRKSVAKGNYGVADFVCPTNELRELNVPEYVIWMDTIKEGRYEDTNTLFEEPRFDGVKINAIIRKEDWWTEELVEEWARLLAVDIKDHEFQSKEPTTQLLGRFQPWHEGHQKLFERALDKHGQVAILVRDMPLTDDNPWHTDKICENIEIALAEHAGKFRCYPVPNIMNITYGRGVGYKIEEEVLDEETQKISATKIREQMRKDGEL
jgi:phosphopantetheine adenylyltransferase